MGCVLQDVHGILQGMERTSALAKDPRRGEGKFWRRYNLNEVFRAPKHPFSSHLAMGVELGVERVQEVKLSRIVTNTVRNSHNGKYSLLLPLSSNVCKGTAAFEMFSE